MLCRRYTFAYLSRVIFQGKEPTLLLLNVWNKITAMNMGIHMTVTTVNIIPVKE